MRFYSILFHFIIAMQLCLRSFRFENVIHLFTFPYLQFFWDQQLIKIVFIRHVDSLLLPSLWEVSLEVHYLVLGPSLIFKQLCFA